MDTPHDQGFDPQAAFVGPDQLEYESFADFLAGCPFSSFRNDQIARLRQAGRSEKDISIWVCTYDGPIPARSGAGRLFAYAELVPCTDRGAGERAARSVAANWALDPKYGHGFADRAALSHP